MPTVITLPPEELLSQIALVVQRTPLQSTHEPLWVVTAPAAADPVTLDTVLVTLDVLLVTLNDSLVTPSVPPVRLVARPVKLDTPPVTPNAPPVTPNAPASTATTTATTTARDFRRTDLRGALRYDPELRCI
jgi:hypothetical protein